MTGNKAALTQKHLDRDEEVRAQMDLCFESPYRLIRAALPSYRRRKTGTIINISSSAGIDGIAVSGLYAASKFALEGLGCPAGVVKVHSADQMQAFRKHLLEN